MITQIVLGDDARGLLSVVKPRAGVAFQGLNVQGAVREVSDPLPGQDGSNDLTAFADVASATLALRLTGQFRSLLDEFGDFCAPFSRPYLEVTDDEWGGPRRLNLRFDSNSGPIVTGTGQSRVVALSWKVPAGVWEYSSGVEYLIPASAPPTTGLIVDATTLVDVPPTGLVVHASNTVTDTLVTNAGTVKAPWRCKLYGPCTGPELYRDDTGEGIVFTTGLVLNAGEYIDLSSADRTANFLSNPDDGRLLYLDYANTTWFDIDPGTNLIRYSPDSGTGPGAFADLTFTPRQMPL